MSNAIASILALAVVLNASVALADENPPVPTTPPPVAQPAPATTGQWVYTTQNGWLWMPYGQSYTYVNADTSLAYEYVYYPAFGWHWVSAPWVLGIGPSPYWGGHGYARFAWHAHPWFANRHAGGGYQMRASHMGVRAFHGGGHGRR
jgi:hypothetical protein